MVARKIKFATGILHLAGRHSIHLSSMSMVAPMEGA
jgi:hypothetical protein